jgi:hypothetical protein
MRDSNNLPCDRCGHRRSDHVGWSDASDPEHCVEIDYEHGLSYVYAPGEVSPRESRVLTRACRSVKSETSAAADVTLRQYWRARAVATGGDPAVGRGPRRLKDRQGELTAFPMAGGGLT